MECTKISEQLDIGPLYLIPKTEKPKYDLSVNQLHHYFIIQFYSFLLYLLHRVVQFEQEKKRTSEKNSLFLLPTHKEMTLLQILIRVRHSRLKMEK